jgi:rhodanese-related sulfurtransferase
MFNSIKEMLGFGPATDYAQLIKDGAMIVDVRTPGEYASGHIKGSVNIPVDQLRTGMSKLKNKQTPIITCCASGMRSATAKSILVSSGYDQVYNGGGWYGLQSKL